MLVYSRREGCPIYKVERKALFEYDLGLPEFKVVNRKEVDNNYLFTVEPVDDQPNRCPECGHSKLYVHKYVKLRARDMEINGHKVGIIINTKRYRCKNCRSVVAKPFNSLDGRLTKRLRDEIRRQSFRENFLTIAERYDLSTPTIINIFNEQAKIYEQEYRLVMPEVLGLDEVHLHKAYCGVFVAVNKEDGRVIELTETRKEDNIKKTLKKMENPENLKYVTMDMWGPYKSAVLEVLPEATIIIDRFHVIKALQNCLESVRRDVSKKIQEQKIRKSLKNNRFLMLTSTEKLYPEQIRRLDEIFKDFPEFQKPYELKEAFRNIYDLATSVEEAESMYDEWCREVEKAGAKEYQDFIDTVSRWHTEVFNYFRFTGDNRTNGQTESLNRIIKDMDRIGRGYSFETLRAKILFGKMIPKKPKFDFKKFEEEDSSAG